LKYGGENYTAAQKEAQANRLGIWKCEEYWLEPEKWRRVFR
jgi:endonuclease YncB( thermonuclease family)